MINIYSNVVSFFDGITCFKTNLNKQSARIFILKWADKVYTEENCNWLRGASVDSQELSEFIKSTQKNNLSC